MSLFGDSAAQSEGSYSESIEEHSTTSSVRSKTITNVAQESSAKILDRSSPLFLDTEDATQDDSSDYDEFSDSSTSTHLSRKESDRRRRYYADDNRLIDAFDAGPNGDLAYNLLGAVLERTSNYSPSQEDKIPHGASKSRWIKKDEINRFVKQGFWSAWPLAPSEVPSRNEWFANPHLTEADPHLSKQQTQSEAANELTDVLSGLAMQNAREMYNSVKISANCAPTVDQNEVTGRPVSNVQNMALGTDEDLSMAFLHPVCHPTIAAFENLLNGLRIARSAQLIREYNATVRRRKSRGLAIKEEVGFNLEQQEQKSDEDSNDELFSLDKAEKAFEENQHLEPRDWSDVLSMAATVGWDQNALQRTMQRCSQLFGESMSLMSLEFKQSYGLEAELQTEGAATRKFDEDGVHVDGFMETIDFGDVEEQLSQGRRPKKRPARR